MNNKKMKFSIVTERFLSVILKVISSKTEISHRELNNINEFMDSIDKNHYSELDIHLDALMESINIIVKFKMKNKDLNFNDSLMLEINSLLSDNYYKEVLENTILPIIINSKNKKFPYELEFINSEIYNHLIYGKILNNKEEIVNLSNEISISSGKEMKNAIMNFQSLLNTFQDYFKEIDLLDTQKQLIYSSEDGFFDKLKEVYNKSKSPSYVLKTGLQLFNEMLSIRNGVIPGLYLFYGNINNFKSAILEYFLKWFHLYNYDVFKKINKKYGKKCAILFPSLENSKQEDFERFVKIYTLTDIAKFNKFQDVEEAWIKAIEEASGVSFEELNQVIEIIYWHPTYDIRPSDIMKTCEKLESQDYKIVGIIIDYIEKIKVELEDKKTNSDQYLLGKISSNLLQISKRFDCPVITAAQLNRAGAALLFSEKDAGKNNAVNNLNTTFIGKDYDIEKPATFSAFIDKETDPYTSKEYLSIKKAKQRGYRTKIETLSHEVLDGIILTDDIKLSKPLSKLAITPDDQDKMAYHISQNSVKNGPRGQMTLTQSENLKNNDTNTISLKDIASSIAKSIAMKFIKSKYKCNILYDKEIITDKNNKKYIKCNKISFKDLDI